MQVTSLPSTPLRLRRRLLGSSLAGALLSPNPIERYFDFVSASWSLRGVRGEVTKVRHQSPRSVTLTIKAHDQWQGFAAGQHVPLTVEIDGVQQTRFYSPANSSARPTSKLELTITKNDDGVVSPFLFAHAAPGMHVGLGPAEGEFVLPLKRPRNIVLISGGSGITPVMSIARTLCDEGHKGQITFLHYARTSEDLLYHDELAKLAAANPNLRVVRAITGPEQGDLDGRFEREHLATVAPEFAKAQTYVCGPTDLIDAVTALYVEEGIGRKLHTEHFVPPKPAVVEGDATGTITFASSGLHAQNDGTSLLDQAERAGLTPQHGCRMGVCHLCVCHVQEGNVRNLRSGEVSSITDQIIQICINAPVGDVKLDL
ncbi:MAG: ferredoxin reductase [Thermoleophilaceae bacterium]|nr:ferredoxin reductase [Thermoleophilaceae bacterium]